jgi:hypothetical protein
MVAQTHLPPNCDGDRLNEFWSDKVEKPGLEVYRLLAKDAGGTAMRHSMMEQSVYQDT